MALVVLLVPDQHHRELLRLLLLRLELLLLLGVLVWGEGIVVVSKRRGGPYVWEPRCRADVNTPHSTTTTVNPHATKQTDNQTEVPPSSPCAWAGPRASPSAAAASGGARRLCVVEFVFGVCVDSWVGRSSRLDTQTPSNSSQTTPAVHQTHTSARTLPEVGLARREHHQAHPAPLLRLRLRLLESWCRRPLLLLLLRDSRARDEECRGRYGVVGVG